MCTIDLFTKLKSKSVQTLVLSLALLFAGTCVQAKEGVRSTGLRQDVYEKMQAVQEFIDKEELGEAHASLNKMRERKLSDYERAQTWFLSGYTFYLQSDYPNALAAYDKVLGSENIPAGMRQNVLSTLSQISMITADYPRALGYVNDLLAISEIPIPDHYVLKAQILYQIQKMDKSMTALEKAISLQEEKGLNPKENWLLLKNAILYSRNDYQGMLQVLQWLTQLYPRDRYLLNMAAIYGELNDSEKQLALMEALYEKGSLNSASQLINLASLYLSHDIPFKGALLLDREISAEAIEAEEKNLELLAQAWLLALENQRAIDPLKRAAELTDDGDTYLRLANTYISLSQWREAEDSLMTALKKGGLKDAGAAQLLLGMVRFNQKDFRSARRAFAQAGKYPKSENLSNQWMNYLAREEEKAAVLDQL